MDKENITKLLDETFENKKARGFINHLVKSYVPNNKVDKIFIEPKSGFKCVLTNEKLVSVNELLDGVKTDEIKDDLFKYLHTMFNPEIGVDTEVKKLINGRQIGIQGDKTDTFMSLDTYLVFHEWVTSKFLSGDKHISWLMGDVNRKKFIKQSGNVNNPELQKSIKKQDRVDMGNRAMYSLGNVSALQALKDKMENK